MGRGERNTNIKVQYPPSTPGRYLSGRMLVSTHSTSFNTYDEPTLRGQKTPFEYLQGPTVDLASTHSYNMAQSCPAVTNIPVPPLSIKCEPDLQLTATASIVSLAHTTSHVPAGRLAVEPLRGSLGPCQAPGKDTPIPHINPSHCVIPEPSGYPVLALQNDTLEHSSVTMGRTVDFEVMYELS